MFNSVQSWRMRRRIGSTQRQLHALSDHILADIGLTRGDISLVGRSRMPSGNRHDQA